MAGSQAENPLIVQGDHTILVEVASPRYLEARDRLTGFAELIKAPEHVHTYRVTPLSIWNACAAGVSAEEIVKTLQEFSKYPVPEHVMVGIRDYASRYGRLRLARDPRGLVDVKCSCILPGGPMCRRGRMFLQGYESRDVGGSGRPDLQIWVQASGLQT